MQIVAEKSGKFFDSRVFKDGDRAIKIVFPKSSEAEDMLFMEHDILLDFDSPYIVKPLDYQIKEGHYIIVTEWVEPEPITDKEKFINGLKECLKELESKGVKHRDIRPKNIIPHNNLPVLIDFGWAHREKDVPSVPDSELVQPNDKMAINDIIGAVK